jgi:hypothetical protein
MRTRVEDCHWIHEAGLDTTGILCPCSTLQANLLEGLKMHFQTLVVFEELVRIRRLLADSERDEILVIGPLCLDPPGLVRLVSQALTYYRASL